MNVAMPLDETKSQVCVSFGRAPYFLLWDSQTNQSTIIDNPGAEAEGGAGLVAAQTVVDSKAEALITVRCGENAGNVFKAAGITVYKSQGADAMENCQAFATGDLAVLDHFHPGFHGA